MPGRTDIFGLRREGKGDRWNIRHILEGTDWMRVYATVLFFRRKIMSPVDQHANDVPGVHLLELDPVADLFESNSAPAGPILTQMGFARTTTHDVRDRAFSIRSGFLDTTG